MLNLRSFYGWRLLAVLMLVFLAAMAFPFFGASVVNAAMAKQLGIERASLGLAFTLIVLFSGLPGPLVAWVVSRIGARWSIVIGSTVVTVGTVLIGLIVTRSWQFIVLFGVVIGTGVCFSTIIPAQATITRWFARRRALALSILWLAVGGGGSIAAPLLARVLAYTGDWRNGWFVMSGLAAVATVVAYFTVVDDPSDKGQVTDGDTTKQSSESPQQVHRRTYQTSDVWTSALALRTPAFWIITACHVAYALPLMVMFAHMIAYLRDVGYSPMLAAGALALVGFAQVVGKLSVGLLGDRIEPRFLWATAMALMAGGLFLLISARSGTDIYAFAILLGMGQGASLVADPTMMGNYFGPKAFAQVSGIQTPIVTIATSLGPLLTGMYYDRTHTYVPSFTTLAVGLIAGTALMIFARPPRVTETTTSLASARSQG